MEHTAQAKTTDSHLTQFIDWAFILVLLIFFQFSHSACWLTTVNGCNQSMYSFLYVLFRCLCTTWKKIHPALPKKYSILNIWFISKNKVNASGRISIQLNCSIGMRTNTSNTPPKKITKQLSKIVFDLCVDFFFWCLASFTTRMNEWTNKCVFVTLNYFEIDVILHHRKFDP